MKKTITFRQNALVGAPGMSSGFAPSIPNAFKISVSLRGVDIKIYGFTGSQWELLHNADGLINSYTTEVVHQKYYFESKTGAEQVVRASFLSSDTRDIDQPRFGVSKETRKLHDIDEVPIYTSSDDGKLLTVRSDGSLAWLGLNESYVVEVIGTGDEGGGSSSTPTGVGTFLEEFTMFGGGTVTDGVLSTSAATPSYYKKSGMVAPSTTATTAVFSMWFNPEQSQMGLYSDQHYPLQVDFGLRMFSSSLLHISTPIGGANGVTLSTPLTLNEWHHALVTVETDIAYTSTSSKSMTVKLYIDGQEVYTKTGNSSSKRIRAYAGIANGTKHYIGAENYNGSVSYKGNGQFDFMEWVDDVTLSDAQILAMYNSGTRGWSVADAAAYEEEQSDAVSYPIVDSIVTDSRFSTYYDASITSEETLQIGSHGSSMLRTTSTSADNDIEEDTTITMWVKSTETFTGEVSLLKFGQWSSDLPKGIHISFKGRKRFIRTAAGEKASSWTNPVIVVKTNDDVRSMSEWKWFHHFHTPYDIRDGEWHQIVFQFVNVGAGLGNYSAGCKIYVDGQKITESFNELSLIEQDENGLQPLSKNPFDCNANSYITIGKGFINSEFDGVTIENQILTEEQIVAKYNAGL